MTSGLSRRAFVRGGAAAVATAVCGAPWIVRAQEPLR